jgi:Flp pilus assembly protein TadD
VEIAALSAELETDSVDTGKLARLARLLHDGHQLEEAVVWYERYLAVDPTDRTIWLDLANCYAILERWEDARAVTLRHLERMPDDPQATYNLGAIYANRGQPELARQFWEQLARQSRDSSLVAMTTQSLARLR